jgi:DHA1 family bicyclomycin/chloramphenicol resistance-like MFS transporter
MQQELLRRSMSVSTSHRRLLSWLAGSAGRSGRAERHCHISSLKVTAMQASFAKSAIVLGLLTAVGPFAIDMYLPALPTIAADLNTSDAGAQATLIGYFIAVALGQLVYGPLSDSFGRKRPLYFGMVLYTLGALGCSLAPTIGWLIAARFVQGMGACAGMVIPRAVVRDLHNGTQAARLMALIMLVFSVSPILAPLFGSTVTVFASWRLIFVTTSLIGLLGLALNAFVLTETRPPEARSRFRLAHVVDGYRSLLADWRFFGTILIGAFGMGSFFAFLSSSSFVYIDHYGLTPTEFSLAFSVNAIAFIGSAQLTGVIARRFGLRRMVMGALTYYFAVTALLVAATLAAVDSLPVLIAGLFIAAGGMGLVVPSVAVLALESNGHRAGSASAMLGTIQLIVAASIIGFVGVFSDGTSLRMVVMIAGCGAVAFVFGLLTLVRTPAPLAAPAE